MRFLGLLRAYYVLVGVLVLTSDPDCPEQSQTSQANPPSPPPGKSLEGPSATTFPHRLFRFCLQTMHILEFVCQLRVTQINVLS